MSAEYEVRLLHQAGGDDLVLVDDFIELDYAQRIHDKGAFTFKASANLDMALAHYPDGRLVVWRKPIGGHRGLDFAGLIRLRDRQIMGKQRRHILKGPDYNEILKRRIIAYDAGSSQAEKSDYADDMMKEFVAENLGTSAGTWRKITDYGFSVEADASAGTSLDKGASRRNLLLVLQELAEASKQTPATATFFRVVPLGNGYDMQFQTRVGSWGQDHRYPGGTEAPVWFSTERGNMKNPRLLEDRRDEINYVYGAGMGEEDNREVVTAHDDSLIYASVINRREALFNGKSYKTDALTDATEGRLADSRPQRVFSFDAVDTPGCRYGIHWHLGDLVTASFEGEQFDFMAAAVRIRVLGKVEYIRGVFEEWVL